jgi:FolB domain-containing protein
MGSVATEDKIFIRNLLVPCRIGLSEDERSRIQNVLIDLEIFHDLTPAGASDDIRKTVNYDGIRQRIAELVSTRQFKLIEAVAESVASLLLENIGTKKVRVIVRKEKYNQSPLMGIEIMRERHE